MRLLSDDLVYDFEGRLVDIAGWLVKPAHLRYKVLFVYAVVAVPMAIIAATIHPNPLTGVMWGLGLAVVPAWWGADKLTGDTPVRGQVETLREELRALHDNHRRRRTDAHPHTHITADTITKMRTPQ